MSDMLRADVFWFPWCLDTETGEHVSHVSSAPFLMRMRYYRGFTDKAAERFVLGRLRETQRTASELSRTTPSDGYGWETTLSRKWRDVAYQRAGMERMHARLFGSGGEQTGGTLLGDDVGMGKTIQCIGVMVRAFREGPLHRDHGVLISTTAAMKSQWADELRKFMPTDLLDTIDVLTVDGSSRNRKQLAFSCPAHVHIINHEMCRLPQYADAVRECALRKGLFVLDETGSMINTESQTHIACKAVSTLIGRAVLFNATPVEKGLTDLVAHADLVDRDLLGTGAANRYVSLDMYGRQRAMHHVGEFKTRINGVYFRRTVQECGVQMPRVIAQVRRVEMDPHQTREYVKAVGEYVSGDLKGAMGFARVASVQRAALADSMEQPERSAKLRDLAHLLTHELAHEKAVVFTRYSTCANAAVEFLRRKGLKPLLITGAVSERGRADARRMFSFPDSPHRVLVLTEAGDKGLNLQAAGVVVNLDLPWTPAKLRQRIGRVRRLSQERSRVLVINYVGVPSNGHPSIDDFMLGLLARKRSVVHRLIGDDGVEDIGKHLAVALAGFLSGTISNAARPQQPAPQGKARPTRS